MVKFLHTADWHLGIKYAKLGENAERAREIRIKTAKKLANLAKEEQADFVIIAGDLFDSNDVDRELIDTVISILKTVQPIPVYILPGNHDPLTRDSLYSDPAWNSATNVVVLKDREPIKLPNLNVTLYPCPITQKQTKEDLTEWIKVTDETISIGVAHGNLRINSLGEDLNFPIDPYRAEKSGLDYLALGEWHSLFAYKGKDGVVRTVYPGTPETTKFGEVNSGKAVLVEISEHGAEPIIKEVEVGIVKWQEWKREIFALDDLKKVEGELDEIESPQHTAINLHLSGVVDEEVACFLEQLMSKNSQKFLYFNLVKESLHLKPNLRKLKTMLPEGAIFNKTVAALQSLMKCHPRTQEYAEISPKEAEEILDEIGKLKSASNASPEVLEKALLLLYQMAKEVSK